MFNSSSFHLLTKGDRGQLRQGGERDAEGTAAAEPSGHVALLPEAVRQGPRARRLRGVPAASHGDGVAAALPGAQDLGGSPGKGALRLELVLLPLRVHDDTADPLRTPPGEEERLTLACRDRPLK